MLREGVLRVFECGSHLFLSLLRKEPEDTFSLKTVLVLNGGLSLILPSGCSLAEPVDKPGALRRSFV